MYWPSGESCAATISGSPKNNSRSRSGGGPAGGVGLALFCPSAGLANASPMIVNSVTNRKALEIVLAVEREVSNGTLVSVLMTQPRQTEIFGRSLIPVHASVH